MTCNHEWVITAMSDISDDLLATHGWLYLKCVFCDGQARVVRPTADEVAQVATIWHTGSYPTYEDTGDGRLIVLDNQRAGGQSVAGDDDDQIDALGTMGWLESAADDQRDDHHADAPAECNHTWHVRGVADEEAASSEIELYCLRCHEWATVPDLTDYECGIIGRAWLLGLALEWQDNKRVQLHRDAPPQVQLTLRRGNADEFNEVDQPRPPVADLVDLLGLFEGEDDEDIPF